MGRGMEGLPSVVLLNGTSSVGKTSLTRELQEALPVPYLRVALDHLFDMVPDPWGGGRGGPRSVEGFRYQEDRDEAGRPVLTIRYGEVGRRMLWAFHRTVGTLVAEGCHVIVDVVALDRADADDWRAVLPAGRTVVVGVTAPIEVLEQRERDLGRRAGLARGHLGAIDLLPPDLVVDSSTAGAPELAQQVIRQLTSDDGAA